MNRTGEMMPISNASRIHTMPSRKTRNTMRRLTGRRSSRARRFSCSCMLVRLGGLALIAYLPYGRQGSLARKYHCQLMIDIPICGRRLLAAFRTASSRGAVSRQNDHRLASSPSGCSSFASRFTEMGSVRQQIRFRAKPYQSMYRSARDENAVFTVSTTQSIFASANLGERGLLERGSHVDPPTNSRDCIGRTHWSRITSRRRIARSCQPSAQKR